MQKNTVRFGLLVLLLFAPHFGHAQAKPTALSGGTLQVGGGVTYSNPDYGKNSLKGISGFVDYDVRPHLGVEATIHYNEIITPDDLAEKSYLIGPRLMLPRGRYTLYGKALVGLGSLVFLPPTYAGAQNSSYFAYSLGGGLDIRVKNHIVIRAVDFEMQHWSYLTGLTPTVVTVGAAYRF